MNYHPTRSVLVDRWTSETRRNYRPPQAKVSSVVLTGTGPLAQRPTPGSTKSISVQTSQGIDGHDGSNGCAARSPFHAYGVHTTNAQPPRVVREQHGDGPSIHMRRRKPLKRPPRFLHPQIKRESVPRNDPCKRTATEQSVAVGEELSVGTPRVDPPSKPNTASAQEDNAVSAIDLSSLLLFTTDLFLCTVCGAVQKAQRAPTDCGGCDAAGTFVRLLAEQRKHSPAKPAAFRDPVPVALVAPKVVPLEQRRTALGEKIHVGRARVRTVLGRESGGYIIDTNSSAQASTCLTWIE